MNFIKFDISASGRCILLCIYNWELYRKRFTDRPKRCIL